MTNTATAPRSLSDLEGWESALTRSAWLKAPGVWTAAGCPLCREAGCPACEGMGAVYLPASLTVADLAELLELTPVRARMIASSLEIDRPSSPTGRYAAARRVAHIVAGYPVGSSSAAWAPFWRAVALVECVLLEVESLQAAADLRAFAAEQVTA